MHSWLSHWHTSRLTTLERERGQIEGFLRRCDSPLEQLLLLALLDTLAARPASGSAALYLRGRLVVPGIGRFSVAIRPQQEVTFSDNTYRADFLVSVERWDWKAGRHRQLVAAVVEVDGHRFHERTRAQAEHDRSRDRQLTAAGFLVLRFTGREVNRDPKAVAAEITELLKRETTKSGT